MQPVSLLFPEKQGNSAQTGSSPTASSAKCPQAVSVGFVLKFNLLWSA